MKTLTIELLAIAAWLTFSVGCSAPVGTPNPLDALTIPNDRSPADGRFGKFGNERP